MTPRLRQLLRAAQPLAPRGSSGVRILVYHLVGGDTGSAVDLSTDAFERQMAELARRGGACSLGEAAALLALDREPPQAAVVVSFDDAYANFFEVAWPILRDLALPCTLFVPTAFVLGERAAPLSGHGDLRPMSWEQIRALQRSGLVEIGSHTHSHRELPKLTDAEVDRELETSAEILDDRLGLRPDHFCYPRAMWSRRVERRVRAVYRTAVIAGGRVNRRGCNAFRLSRIPMRDGMPARLAPLLEHSVWLEEWAASKLRRIGL